MKSITLPFDDIAIIASIDDADTRRRMLELIAKAQTSPESVSLSAYATAAEPVRRLAARIVNRVEGARKRRERRKSIAAKTRPLEITRPHRIEFPLTPRVLCGIKDMKNGFKPFFTRVIDLFSAAKSTPEIEELLANIESTRGRLELYLSYLFSAYSEYYTLNRADRPDTLRLRVQPGMQEELRQLN